MASLYAASTDQIYIMTEYRSEIVFHPVQVEEGVPGFLVQRDQHIHIAFWAEIIAKYRAKQREFGYVPALAERSNLCSVRHDFGG